MLTYANFYRVEKLIKLNFNFIDVRFSPTLTMFFFFLTISKINIKLSNDIKFIKENIINLFYNINSLLYVFEDTKLNFVQICLMFYCFAS